ncbi:hypothetical protein ACAS46_000908 [Vibrio vulnificus]
MMVLTFTTKTGNKYSVRFTECSLTTLEDEFTLKSSNCVFKCSAIKPDMNVSADVIYTVTLDGKKVSDVIGFSVITSKPMKKVSKQQKPYHQNKQLIQAALEAI